MTFKREQIVKGIFIAVISSVCVGLFRYTRVVGNASDIKSLHFKKSSVHTYNHELSKVLFLPNSKKVATIGMDASAVNYLKLWDYANSNKIQFLKTNYIAKSDRATSMATNQTKDLLAISEESDLLASQAYDSIDVYNIKTQKSIKRLKFNVGITEQLSSHDKVTFSPDGKFLIFVASTLRIWRTQDWKLIATVNVDHGSENKGQTGIIDCVISSDSKWFATLANTSEVRLWDIKSGQLLPNDQQPLGIISNEHKFDPNTYNDSKIQVSSDGKFLYIIINYVYPHEAIYDIKKYKGVGVAFYKWDLTNHKLSSINLVKNFTFAAVTFSSDGKYFVMAGYNKSSEVSLWDLTSFSRIQTLVTGEGSYYDVDVSSGGDIAAAQDDGELLLWQNTSTEKQ